MGGVRFHTAFIAHGKALARQLMFDTLDTLATWLVLANIFIF